MSETYDCRVPFAETLIELAEADERIVAVCNDSVGSSNLNGFQVRFPDRLVNVGIAEQNMVGVAAGLANTGLIPFVCAAGPFLTGRALEQIKADVAYSEANVKLCGMSPGFAYGELGSTHHSIEDISWMRAIDKLQVVVPADPEQTREAVRWAASTTDAVYLRIGRFKVPSVSAGQEPAFEVGRALVLREGEDVTIVANGVPVSRALAAAEALAVEGISARVVNCASVVPLDERVLLESAERTGAIVVVEEAVTKGGLGAAVAELVVRHHPVPMELLGTDHFAPTGSAEFLFEHYGIGTDGIIDAVRKVVARAH